MQILKRKPEENGASTPSTQRLTSFTSTPAATATVTDAVAELGCRVDKQVEQAIARAESRSDATTEIDKDLRSMLDARTKTGFEANAKIAASAIKHELEQPGNEEALADALPLPVAKAVEKIVDEVAQGHMPDSWDNDDVLSTKESNAINVYNFPMKPFTSLTISEQDHQICAFNDAEIFDIARLKKDFDQVDRTLVTASPEFLIYGMPKNGGIRAIRQLDGKDIKLFEDTKDRVFNVSISTALDSDAESVVGTGVSGTVYWVDLKAAEADFIEDGNASTNNHGFAFPTIQHPGEETSGGMLKTRARTSTSHPEFFAVGRGKLIHIIWPAIITKQRLLKPGKERVVDTEKYLQQHSLKINTGKAGKDFVFSHDDTTIVSLDKAGRVKLWDVRSLTTPEHTSPTEIQEPMFSFNTTRENSKAWPTSVLFVDKERPYKQGGPLRYLLVGMEQNHVIQLWDLVLRRAVQEIVLPHEKESDAVCSIAYHPATGILAIGHPTRNSIYFIHVSCPKYDASRKSSQADFITQIASKSTSESQPKSTAVMSGMREYSLGSKGQLRSLDMLLTPASSATNEENPVLFELYMMHSKGVTYVVVKREDMGWTADMKTMNAHDALSEGLITMTSLKEVANYGALTDDQPLKADPKKTVQREASVETAPPVTKVPEQSPIAGQKKLAVRTPSPTKTHKSERAIPSATIDDNAPHTEKPIAPVSTDKIGKNKKKKAQSSASTKDTSALKESELTNDSTGGASSVPDTRDAVAGSVAEKPQSSSATGPNISEDTVTSVVGRVSSSVTEGMSKVLSASFDGLYKHIKDDRRAQQAQHGANQEALIKIVASTLEENVGRKLEGIIGESMTRSVVPAINNGINVNVVPAVTQTAKTSIAQAIKDQLSSHLSSHLNAQVQQAVSKELKVVLPEAITKSLHQGEVLRLMSESLARGVAFKVEEQFATLMKDSIVPAFTDVAIQAAQQASAEVQRQASVRLEQQAAEYNDKIDKLTQVVGRLIETTSAVEHSQAKLSEQFIKAQQAQQVAARDAVVPQQTPHQLPPVPQHSTGLRSVSARVQAPPQMQQLSVAPQPSQPQPRMPSVAQQVVRLQEPEVSELDRALMTIAQDMVDNNFEQACMHWLQFDSRTKQDMFVKYFSQVDPAFVVELSDLMLLSLSSIVSDEFEGPTFLARLKYLETVLDEYSNRNVADPQIVEVVPRIMSLVLQRSENIFARISSVAPQDQSLQRLLVIMQSAKRISAGSSLDSWQSNHDGW